MGVWELTRDFSFTPGDTNVFLVIRDRMFYLRGDGDMFSRTFRIRLAMIIAGIQPPPKSYTVAIVRIDETGNVMNSVATTFDVMTVIRNFERSVTEIHAQDRNPNSAISENTLDINMRLSLQPTPPAVLIADRESLLPTWIVFPLTVLEYRFNEYRNWTTADTDDDDHLVIRLKFKDSDIVFITCCMRYSIDCKRMIYADISEKITNRMSEVREMCVTYNYPRDGRVMIKQSDNPQKIRSCIRALDWSR